MLKPLSLVVAALGLSLTLMSAEAEAAKPTKNRGSAAQKAEAAQKAPAKGGASKGAARHEHSEKHGNIEAKVHGRASPAGKSRRRASTTIVAAHVSSEKLVPKRAAAKTAKKPPAPPPTPPESIGNPNDGRLVGGARLNTSLPYVRVVPAHASGDTQWGLPILIKMIERSAQRVAKRYPGSALDVGDISRKNGGDINGHHSHESGRDADLGFYAVNATGKQVHAGSFIKFDGSLSSSDHPGARFDLARNWLFIQSLLTDPAARVSHIFIAEPLRQVLLAHARSRGVSKAMWVRAAVAMMQPTESLPHDDHIHVRISCPRSMNDTCIELSKNAPSKAARVARAKRRSRSVTLRTPNVRASHRRGGHNHASARRARSGDTRTASAPSKAPGVNEPEAEADAFEVKGAIDEIGAVKITD